VQAGTIMATALAAIVLITFGAWRYLALADRQRDQVECIKHEVQIQAEGTARMASAVLNLSLAVEQRRNAVAVWSNEQADIADRIEGC
jgi:hypothetical protein